MANKIALYRPYFSAAEIAMIAQWAERESAANPNNADLLAFYKKLRMISYKIGNDIIKPVLMRDKTMEEKIGLMQHSETKPESELRDRLNDLATRYMNDPLSLTKEEIAEGKRLELIEYKMDMGMFPQESN